MTKRIIPLAMAAAILAPLSGCSATESLFGSTTSADPQDGAKQWDGTIRHDIEPLKKRFRNIGEDYTAIWAGGDYGNSRTPGLETVWLDAVIHLDAAQTKRLEERLGTSARREIPEIKKELRKELPAGGAATSADLNDYVNAKPNQVRLSAHLYETANILVVNYISD